MIPASAETLLLGSGAAEAYKVERSLRFNSADSAYLSRTPASAGNRKTWTWAGWVKRSALGYVSLFSGAGANDTSIEIAGGGTLVFYSYTNTYLAYIESVAVFRDPSAWYHIVVSVDSTQATAANRAKLYVNGSQITNFGTANYPAQDLEMGVNTASQLHTIGVRNTLVFYLDGYLAEIHFIDGQALTPSDFGETDANGVWQPKAYTGSYGTNGFRLDFADNSSTTALGYDAAGSNDWTPNNFSVTAGVGNDSLVDTPTSYGTDTGAGGEVRGNYCTLNPLVNVITSATPTISEGNLKIAPGGTNDTYYVGTQTLTGGKFYYEVTVDSVGGGVLIGVCPTNEYTTTSNTPGTYRNDGTIKDFAGTTITSGSTFTTGDVIGVAVDIDAGTVKFYKNNVGQGATPSISFTAGTPVVPRGRFDSATSGTLICNFGQRPFAYTAPSGFKALCDTNLPTPTIAKPNTVMDTVLYTGTGATLTPTSSLGFSPDLVWIKGRSGATDHTLYDVVRGAQARLESNTTDAEVTSDNGLTAFNSAGFTLGTLAEVNTNTATYAAWTWDAGSSTVTNTQGSISSQVRANASAGFSVVTYTGTGSAATVGHGLGVAPSLLIVKQRSAVRAWEVYHKDLGASYYLELNVTNAKGGPYSGLWNDTAPTSTVFSIKDDGGVNQSTGTYVAYCFAPVAGYSSFGSYTGNGSADGPFVFTGFRPKYLLLKRTDAIEDWAIRDTSRSPYNQSIADFAANLSNSEYTDSQNGVDILSNGFKLRNTRAMYNASASTYIYAAFAESPFAYARAR